MEHSLGETCEGVGSPSPSLWKLVHSSTPVLHLPSTIGITQIAREPQNPMNYTMKNQASY